MTDRSGHRDAPQELVGGGGIRRTADVESLGEIAPEVGQRVGRGLGLDALGCWYQAERVRDLHDCLDEQRFHPKYGMTWRKKGTAERVVS